MDVETVQSFMRLFEGREDAWGTGKGAVVKGHLRETHYAAHLAGWQPGLGIFPLQDDGTVRFAAIDLDEPNRAAAFRMQELLPGTTWLEKSRSGNFHVWAFFDAPIEAWIPRSIMKLTVESVGVEAEIFPKQDKLLPGMVGNYINLPYWGDERKIWSQSGAVAALDYFVRYGIMERNDPERWRVRARSLNLRPQEIREGREQGTAKTLHVCAERIIRERFDNPIAEGHRHIVLFNLAKMLLHWEDLDDDEAWSLLGEVNYASPDPLPQKELRRIFLNAQRGGYTSTGCDNPVMAPYVDPTCRIAHGSRAR